MGLGLNLGQVNFSKGVLAKELHSRVDINTYSAGLKRGENVVVLKRGGVSNRMGTRFVTELQGPGRLLPFEFSIDQTYALAFTQGRMTPMALGGAILEEELRITAITNESPAVVTVPFHGYATGDRFFALAVEGMTEINGRALPITVLDGDRFSVPVDARAWGLFAGSGGGTLRTDPAPPPPPPPPPVPPPPPTPVPPSTGGGGGVGGGGYRPNYQIP